MKQTQKPLKSKKVKTDYEQQVDDAYNDIWEALSSEDFRTSDFSDIASMHGVDEDDLLDCLI